MEKKRLFKIMAKMNTKQLTNLTSGLIEKYEINLIKEPSKSLTMIQMREPVKSSLFYLGEVLVCEAVIEFEGAKGMALYMGDDYEKVQAMAILDGAFNKRIDEVNEIVKLLLNEESKQIEMAEKENAMHLKTMVNFSSLDSEGK